MPPSNTCLSSFMTQPLRNSIFIQYVAPQAIIDVVNTIKPKSSSGQDEIWTNVMKATITHIINPVTHIINQSLKTRIVPDKMKIAKVVPIFKSSNQSLLKYYRSIRLLSALLKVLEKVVYNQLKTFFKYK